MTKLKNTKKGMAKKALSISLVAAMLATSNVPVWAADFSDGTEVEAFTSELETENIAPAAEILNATEEASDVELMSASEYSFTAADGTDVSETGIVWGNAVTFTVAGGPSGITPTYQWYDDKNEAIANATSATYTDTTGEYAGKTIKAVATYTLSSGVTSIIEGTVKVLPVDKSSLSLSLTGGPSYSLVSGGVEPDFTITGDTTPTTYVESVDYDVNYLNNTTTGDINDDNPPTVVVNFKGKYSGTVEAKFTITGISLDTSTITFQEGTEVTYSANIDDYVTALNGKETVKTSMGQSLTTNDYTLEVTGTPSVAAGAQVVAVGKGNYSGSTSAATVTVKEKALTVDMVAEIPDQPFANGAAVTPDPVVKDGKDKDGNVVTLVKGNDYTVTYNHNYVDGVATAIITGTGNYTGTVEKNFNIVKENVDFSSAFKAAADSLLVAKTYTGSAIDPVAQQKIDELLYRYDYTYAITNNVNAGTATVTFTGVGKYDGATYSKDFTIEAADINSIPASGITVADTIYNAKVTETGAVLDKIYAQPAFTLSFSGKTLLENQDYTIDKFEVTGGGAVGTENIELTVTGYGNFKGTKVFKGKIVANTLENVTAEPIEPQTYTGNPVNPAIVLKDGTKTLVVGTDYTIKKWENNIKVGMASVTLEGMGNYSGEKVVNFQIVKAEINAYVINGSSAAKPTEDNQKLDSVEYVRATALSDNGITLTPGTDFVVVDKDGKLVNSNNYEVKYSNNKAAGTASIIIEGKEGFEITAANTFTIEGASLAGQTISKFTVKDAQYTGEAVTPESDIEIKDATDVTYTLVEGTDYEIVCENNTDVTASAVLKVVGKGNYAGNLTKTFEVKSTVLTVECPLTAEYAGGMDAVPAIKVINSSTQKELIKDVDYKLTLLTGGKELGTASVKIELIGDADSKDGFTFTAGSSIVKNVTRSYKVIAKDMANVEVSPVADVVVTGEQIKPAVTVMNGSVKMTEGTDYEIVYGENKEVGEGTVTVKALDTNKNYTGSQTIKFNIVKSDADKVGVAYIENVTVAGNKATVALSGHVANAQGYDFVIATEEDYKNGRVSINKNILTTSTAFQYVDEGTYYAYCHAWKRDEDGKKVFGGWSNLFKFEVTATTPSTPKVTAVKVTGNTVKVTYTKCDDAIGYDVILGASVKKVNGESRPVEYGKLVKKITKGNTVTATFTNVPKGTYYAGLHAYNRTSANKTKVFSKWSNSKKVTVK